MHAKSSWIVRSTYSRNSTFSNWMTIKVYGFAWLIENFIASRQVYSETERGSTLVGVTGVDTLERLNSSDCIAWNTSKSTAESGFREQPPCRHLRSLNPDWSLNPDSFGSRKFPYQKSEASKSRPASKYQFSKYRLICTCKWLKWEKIDAEHTCENLKEEHCKYTQESNSWKKCITIESISWKMGVHDFCVAIVWRTTHETCVCVTNILINYWSYFQPLWLNLDHP